MKVDRMTIDPRTVVSMNAFSNSSYNSVSVVVQNEKHIFPPTQYILYTRAWLISILTLFSKPEPSATHLVCILAYTIDVIYFIDFCVGAIQFFSLFLY